MMRLCSSSLPTTISFSPDSLKYGFFLFMRFSTFATEFAVIGLFAYAFRVSQTGPCLSGLLARRYFYALMFMFSILYR